MFESSKEIVELNLIAFMNRRSRSGKSYPSSSTQTRPLWKTLRLKWNFRMKASMGAITRAVKANRKIHRMLSLG